MCYDPQGVQTFFSNYGTREWERLERTLQGRIKYAIHRRFLDEYVSRGVRVLGVGCGLGRFAIDLAQLDAWAPGVSSTACIVYRSRASTGISAGKL